MQKELFHTYNKTKSNAKLSSWTTPFIVPESTVQGPEARSRHAHLRETGKPENGLHDDTPARRKRHSSAVKTCPGMPTAHWKKIISLNNFRIQLSLNFLMSPTKNFKITRSVDKIPKSSTIFCTLCIILYNLL